MHKSGHIHLRLLVTACALATVAGVFLLAGAAGASPQVTIAAGNPANNQAVTVSGSGFPSRRS